ncbi:unnamed protein product [Ambrosiozyma monospora]|uniref:Unnamed protein product n=1 Tax=Ambrosiozyma monospora TaxID=43982 RepID=A0ACB5U7G7_AMBMO|nr:unnamed protein product [Ambrosiozyma monospora]
MRMKIHQTPETVKGSEETPTPGNDYNLSPPAHVVPSIDSIMNHRTLSDYNSNMDTSSAHSSVSSSVPPCNVERVFSTQLEPQHYQQQPWYNTQEYEILPPNTYQTNTHANSNANANPTTEAPHFTSTNYPSNPLIPPNTTTFSCTGEPEHMNLYGGTNILQEAESLFNKNMEYLFGYWDSRYRVAGSSNREYGWLMDETIDDSDLGPAPAGGLNTD